MFAYGLSCSTSFKEWSIISFHCLILHNHLSDLLFGVVLYDSWISSKSVTITNLSTMFKEVITSLYVALNYVHWCLRFNIWKDTLFRVGFFFCSLNSNRLLIFWWRKKRGRIQLWKRDSLGIEALPSSHLPGYQLDCMKHMSATWNRKFEGISLSWVFLWRDHLVIISLLLSSFLVKNLLAWIVRTCRENYTWSNHACFFNYWTSKRLIPLNCTKSQAVKLVNFYNTLEQARLRSTKNRDSRVKHDIGLYFM